MTLRRTDWRFLKHPPKYTKSNHIVWGHRDMDGLDATFRALFIGRKGLERLQAQDQARWMAAKLAAEDQTLFSTADAEEEAQVLVPPAFRNAYKVQRTVLMDVWRPNADLRAMMDDLKLHLAPSDSPGPSPTADRVVIAAHVRLGDKHRELSHLLPRSMGHRPNEKPGLHNGLLAAFYGAAERTVDGVLARGHGHERKVIHNGGESWEGRKATLAVMSDDVGAVAAFERHRQSIHWRVASTSPPDTQRSTAGQQKGGFRETAFNHLPLAARVHMAQKFVADLTILALESDGIVLTASSNVGRLMSLLAGEEKAIVKKRVTSLDTRWFPSASFL